MGTPIRVAIVSTFRLLHEGLIRVLGEDPTLSVTPEMLTAEELVHRAEQRELHIAVIHVSNGVSPGAWQTIESLCRHVKVMLLLKRYHTPTVTRALETGVTGILTEDGSGDGAIFKALHEVAAGSVWCEPAPRSLQTEGRPPRPSSREKEVMALICQGLSNRDIANRLCISERTVKSHVNRLLHKFQVKNRVQLALHADDRLYNHS